MEQWIGIGEITESSDGGGPPAAERAPIRLLTPVRGRSIPGASVFRRCCTGARPPEGTLRKGVATNLMHRSA
jgi:hypothetical protein